MNKKQRKYEEQRREKVNSHTNIFTVQDCACFYIFLFFFSYLQNMTASLTLFQYLFTYILQMLEEIRLELEEKNAREQAKQERKLQLEVINVKLFIIVN